ncbi:ABC transporter permease [Paracoccus sp. APAP_BH8]|uniref:ABC transporter permease n=1 Tax=Paracoccus pantotrophus TaxID=82367 RepID=A0A7H9BY37_PARPN|nr:ABC transporter permease [Paracoccus pantotrophus]MDF3855885.1 ABC transporter permease [Paracoccus pantotrophus]QLH15686.1 ABC transporter permease [Paracoccus pantotrophus]RDE00831.1 ABC transporter permease [Paracoccus pantotrophus]WGR63898.1 ABC transporter permease [Paracoccus pantotrophus]SFO84825.1 NitT/TauT family transport system permease protein [Paracoccus pantotrophus]
MTGPPRSPALRPGLVPGVLSILAMLLVWTLASQLTDRPQTLPAPWDVAARIGRLAATGELWFNAGMTLFRVVASFALAMAAGMALGLWMGRSRGADQWLNPGLIILLNVPALVVIVLCYIWIGLNETAAILAVALNKIPVVTVMIREGTRALRPDLDDMARAFRMRPWARLRHVVLPQLAPHVAASARAGISLIWKIVLVVEFLGRSNGVGFKIHLLFSSFDVTGVLAWALAFVAVMLAIDLLLLRPWESRANRWRQDAA